MRRLSIAKFAYVHHPLQDTLILLIRDYESSRLLSHIRAPCKCRRWPLLGSRACVEIAIRLRGHNSRCFGWGWNAELVSQLTHAVAEIDDNDVSVDFI